jgi:hypothetical protein
MLRYFNKQSQSLNQTINENESIRIINKRKCIVCFDKRPSFNLVGLKATHCFDCKTNDMKNVVSKLCIDCNLKQPHFNLVGLKATHCGDCKTNDMVDVKHTKCIDCNLKHPIYNLIGLKALYCGNCKTNDMVNVVSKLCIDCNLKRPSYNLIGLKALYCFDCKTNDMVDVKHTKCIECNLKQPSYNLIGLKALYCSDCKTNDMVDVTNPKCIECNLKQPYYNLIGLKALYCSDCKTNDMVDVKHIKCIDCNLKIPNFNLVGLKALYCSDCKTNDMVDVKNKKCKTELCDTQVSHTNYKGHCLRCFMYLFPNEPVARNYKTKETFVADFIKESFPNNEWVFDKSVDNGCSRRRPDIRLELYTHNIVIEVDENQHRDYDVSCENKRMMEIFQDLGSRNIVFIRFNPDDYLDNEKNVTSCWGVNKQGICVVKKSKAKEWTQRLEELKNKIEYWLDKIPEKEVEIVHLFYDN